MDIFFKMFGFEAIKEFWFYVIGHKNVVIIVTQTCTVKTLMFIVPL